MRRLSRSLPSSSGRLVVTRPSTTIFLGTKRSGSNARALVVVLEEEAVHLEVVEERLGHEVVAALGRPHRLVVAAAHVGRHRKVAGPGQRPVDVGDVLLVEVLGVAADSEDVACCAGSLT